MTVPLVCHPPCIPSGTMQSVLKSNILSKENHTPVPVAHTEVIFFKFKGVGADIVFKIVTFPHGLYHIKGIYGFLACSVEVMRCMSSGYAAAIIARMPVLIIGGMIGNTDCH